MKMTAKLQRILQRLFARVYEGSLSRCAEKSSIYESNQSYGSGHYEIMSPLL